MNPTVKVFLIGCGGLAVLVVAVVTGLVAWLASGPSGGVKLGNDMDRYALDYLADHGLLEAGEEVLAYYDATIGLDGTEAAILTPERLIYHKNGNTTSIPITEIEDVQHRYETFAGDVIEVVSISGRVMKIEIAPLNQGETFKSVLLATWKRSKDANGSPAKGVEKPLAA